MEYTQTIQISKKELVQLRTDLRNSKNLHSTARKRVVALEAENKALKAEVKELRQTVSELVSTVEKLSLRNEELCTKVFGKKHRKGTDDTSPPTGGGATVRTKNSYKRSIPKKEDITHTEHHRCSVCTECNETLTLKRTREYYEEDIIRPQRKVTHHTVEQGYCMRCRVWSSGTPLPSTRVTLGDTLRAYVCYSVTILRLSSAQTKEHLADTFGITVSLGEIIAILHKRADEHEGDYTDLIEKVRSELVLHTDETSTRIRDGDGYSAYTWLMEGVAALETVFSIGRTRGKGVAEELLGDSDATGVTDDYGVYTNLFKNHQLCWAHLHRKFRDLATSDVLEGETKRACIASYEHESEIYKTVRKLTDSELTDRQRKVWHTKLNTELSTLATITNNDPPQLQTYKHTLQKNIPKYLTCIRLPGVPPDNNQAERSLRHYVLKRKISFGHTTAKGAKTMSILMSVFVTTLRRARSSGRTFFGEYAGFGGVGV